MEKDKILNEIYLSPKYVGSYAGVKPLYTEAKKINHDITLNDVKNFLLKKRSYTLHKQIKRKYSKLKTTASGIGTSVQCDLLDPSNVSKFNKNFKFLLVTVDVFSRLIHVEPLKNKSSAEVLRGLDKIFKSWLYPWAITTDRNDFSSNELKNYYKQHEILKYECLTSPDVHCAVVENVHKQIRDKLEKFYTENKTYRWLNIIDDVVYALNHTPSRTLGMAPSEVNNENSDIVRQKWEGQEKAVKKPKFKVGDFVRIASQKGVFKKGTREKFSEEVFVVKKVFRNKFPATYEIADLAGESILGKFYEEDFSKVLIDENTEYPIEKILRRRTRNGKQEWYVKFVGYSDKFNAWVAANN